MSLRISQLSGFGKRGSEGPAVTLAADDGDYTTFSGTTTLAHAAVTSTGPQTVIIVVVSAGTSSSRTLDSGTLDGNALNIVAQRQNQSSADNVLVAVCTIDGAQSGTLSLVFSGAMDSANAMATVLSFQDIQDLASANYTDGAIANATSIDLTSYSDNENGCSVFGWGNDAVTACSWSPGELTERFDADIGVIRASTASLVGSMTGTTVTANGANNWNTILGVTFR